MSLECTSCGFLFIVSADVAALIDMGVVRLRLGNRPRAVGALWVHPFEAGHLMQGNTFRCAHVTNPCSLVVAPSRLRDELVDECLVAIAFRRTP